MDLNNYGYSYENANRLISVVKEKINNSDYDPSYAEFLMQQVTDKGIPEKEKAEYVLDHFYESDQTTIKEAGVNLMLKAIGIIK
jgi:hypothetical protein